MMKRSIFFDLDGTLWDAIDPLVDAYNETMKRHGYDYTFDYAKVKSCMGLTPEETGSLFFPELPVQEGIDLFKLIVREEITYLAKHPGKLYPHEREVLAELKKKYDLYVVSNADVGYIENYLDSHDMHEYFKGHLCAGDTGMAKWQNIVYLRDKEKIDDVIYVGDTNKDKIETQRAKAKFIHAAYGFGTIDPDPYKIDSLDELPALAEKLFNM